MSPFDVLPKCIIYDWNGTLLDDVELCYDLLHVLLRRYHIPPISLSRYREVFTFPIIDYYREVGFTFDTDSYEYIADEIYMPLYLSRHTEATLAEGAESTLSTFHERGVDQIILSASEQSLLDTQVSYYGIEDYFVSVYGSRDNYASSKVDIARQFLLEHAYSPDEVVMIGDTIHDYEIATEIGCRSILVFSGHQSRERLESTGATVVDGILDVLSLFI